ncbi:hypothetical protein DFJ73DRAFT_233735 [Zopfochytrium polystomum]|nr:hypothetical protein DFJ73DRAFT_233735 [Zopfochytrium polystomum]
MTQSLFYFAIFCSLIATFAAAFLLLLNPVHVLLHTARSSRALSSLSVAPFLSPPLVPARLNLKACTLDYSS